MVVCDISTVSTMAYTVYMHSIRNAYQQNSTLVKWNLEEVCPEMLDDACILDSGLRSCVNMVWVMKILICILVLPVVTSNLRWSSTYGFVFAC